MVLAFLLLNANNPVAFKCWNLKYLYSEFSIWVVLNPANSTKLVLYSLDDNY